MQSHDSSPAAVLSSAILTLILQPLQGLAIRLNHHEYNGLPLVPHTLNLHWKHLLSQEKRNQCHWSLCMSNAALYMLYETLRNYVHLKYSKQFLKKNTLGKLS